MKSRLPNNMQQKYCDQGPSGRIEDHATELARAQLVRLGRKCEKGFDLPFGEHLQRVGGGYDDPVDVLVGIEPDLRDHDREELMSARAVPLGDAYLPALQVTDGTNWLPHEELIAPGMHAG
jgi:hypothetical protein